MSTTYRLCTGDEAVRAVLDSDPTWSCPTCGGKGYTVEPRLTYDVIHKGSLRTKTRAQVMFDLGRADVIQWRPSEMHGWVLWVLFEDTSGFGIVGLDTPEDFDA